MPVTSIDDDPAHVQTSALQTSRFGKAATSFDDCLEPAEFDIDEKGSDGKAVHRFGSESATTAYDKAGSSGTTSVGGSSGHNSWNETWKSQLAEPGVPNHFQKQDSFQDRKSPKEEPFSDTWTAEPGTWNTVMGSPSHLGQPQAAALAAAMQAPFPAWPPFPPAYGMPQFPWWDPSMYHQGGMMSGHAPGGEKEYFQEMANTFEQMAQHHSHQAKSYGRTGRQSQKGKGKANLAPVPGFEKEYYENMAQTLGQMAHQHALAAKSYNPQQQQQQQQGVQGSGRQQQKGKGGGGQMAPKAAGGAGGAPEAPKQEVPQGNQDIEDHVSYTTVMLKNVPSSYTRELLIQTLNEEGFFKRYNFVYLPMEFKKKVLLGYAFVNLIDHETALKFRIAMAGYEKWLADAQGNRLELDGEKTVPAEVRWGKLHDKQKHIDRYRSSDLMHPSVPKEYKPMAFGADGQEEPFPGPERGRRTQPPRALKNDQPGSRKKEAAAAAAASSPS